MDTRAVILIAAFAAAWGAWACVVRWIVAIRPYGDDGYAAAIVRAFQIYARLWQRTRYEGLGHIPRATRGGDPAEPVIVVSNHTAGIDPILIQAACPFAIRFVMAQDMRVPFLDDGLRYARVIFIDRELPTGMELREAMTHLRNGGALGVFPEGAIEHSPGDLLPFRAGVGVIVRRSRAAVLPVAITGTPRARSAWGSFFMRSRAGVRVRFLRPVRFDGSLDATGVARGLEDLLAGALLRSGA